MAASVITKLKRLQLNSSANKNSASFTSIDLNATSIPNIPEITSIPEFNVIIEPKAEYKDWVTIYPNIDMVDTTKRKQGPDLSIEGSNENVNQNLCRCQNIPRWLIILVVCAIILGIAIGVLFIIFGNSNQPTESKEKTEKSILFQENTNQYNNASKNNEDV